MQTASSAPRKGALTRALSAPGTANGLILLGAVLQVLFFILYLIRDDKDAVAFLCPQAGEQSVQLARF